MQVTAHLKSLSDKKPRENLDFRRDGKPSHFLKKSCLRMRRSILYLHNISTFNNKKIL